MWCHIFSTFRSPSAAMPRSCPPPEISDHIVDLLHDDPKTLKKCSLVSKSWVPRARQHLFHEVAFYSLNGLDAWEETFPDPVNSPAYYTRSLHIRCADVLAEELVEKRDWLRAFSNIVRLRVQVGTRTNTFVPSAVLTGF